MKKLLALFLVVCLAALGVASTFEAPFALVFGWIGFLWRVLPEVTVNGSSVAVGCGAFVLFAGGVHWAGTAWYRQRPAEQAEPARPWKLRWSMAIVVGVCVLFAAGISLVGVVHQGIWLLDSGRPLTEEVEQVRRNWDGSSEGNLKLLGIAIASHAGDHQGNLTQDGARFHSWETHLLPYVPFSTRGIDFKRPWNDPANQKPFQSVISIFINPELRVSSLTDPNGYGLSHYAANVHLFGKEKADLGALPNGASQTILIGEVNAEFKPWGDPSNLRDPLRGINRSPHGFGGPPGSGGAFFSMANGSVQFVSEKVSPGVLRSLSGLDASGPRDKMSARPTPFSPGNSAPARVLETE